MSPAVILAALKGGWGLLTGNPWRTTSYVLLLALSVFFVKAEVYKHELATCQTARFEDQTATQLASAQSTVENLNHVVATERTNAKIATEKQHEIEGQLDANRASAARYASLHPAPKAVARSTGQGDLPAAAEPAADPAATAAETVVHNSDLDACAVDYTIAAGWQDWWQKVSQSSRDTDAP